MQDIFVARQPIYDRELNLVGYELLYRDTAHARARFDDGAQASSKLIINTFIDFGLEKIVGSSPAFINLPRDFLVDDQQPIPMRCEQVVLELHESEAPSPEAVDGLRQLVAQGYTVALDDFVYHPDLEPLLELAHIVKLDLGVLGRDGLAEQMERCRSYPVKLLAEKVETPDDLEYCAGLGFDYFQGFFFCRPELVRERSHTANRAVILQIMERLQDETADMADLETVIIQDVALTYKLLRYLNSAAYGMRREINSVREALTLIGLNEVRKWAILLLMSSYDSDKPTELIATAMVRARMCELMARGDRARLAPDQAFTVGLFATLDALMHTPMEELLDSIALNTQVKLALLEFDGPLGHLLRQVLLYERGEWAALDTETFAGPEFAAAYLGAVQWANENYAALVRSQSAAAVGSCG